MGNYIVRRLLQMIPTVLLSSIFVFTMMNLVRGDAIDIYFGLSEGRTPEAEQALREQLGIDKPPYMQYLIWLGKALQGDFGESWRFKEPVTDMIGKRLFLNLELWVIAAFISIFFSSIIGLYTAAHQNGIVDQITRFAALVLLSAPFYWVAMIILVVLSKELHWTPPLVYKSVWEDPKTHFQMIMIPSVLWGITSIFSFSRYVRNCVLDVLRSNYIRAARARGVSQTRALFKHTLMNAAGPLATIVALGVGQVVGGMLFMEMVFVLPGMGRLFLEAIFKRDYPVIMAISFLISVTFVVVNLVADLIYGILDPRIRYD
jgi:peptide/nickel transport system permease protein